MGQPIERNLAMDLVRVTEAAAMAAARFMGRGDKEAADQAAVDAMRYVLSSIDMDGVVVIGEGEKDEAPMLYIGEEIGNRRGPQTDVAVDPIDGTRLLANGLPNAISVVALAERGKMLRVPRQIVYMDKIAVGADAKGKIDIEAPVADNLRAVARATGKAVQELTVVVLDRPRHSRLIADVRAAGARLRLISDGDVAGAIMAAMEEFSGIDMLLGVGGAPEAVIAAAALKCLGGDMQCRFYPRDEREAEAAAAAGFSPGRVFTIDDLVGGEDVFFAATGITDGELVRGVRYTGRRLTTESIVMRCRSGTIRRIFASHDPSKLSRISEIRYSAENGVRLAQEATEYAGR
ncbi:MAG: class II fructose-bisphosphatase [Chloroflexi bacterium]|nr:class II fructose-bisphosphatase [Chloroflexota bacterium]GIW09611.1 MAG: fructose-1,6-bisphosphatase [Dehalococcoidia bacterium]